MDKHQALYSFWSSFGLPVYDQNTVPEDAALPYITYEDATDSLNAPIPLDASLWYRSSSWAEISQKEDVISRVVESHPTIPVDIGYLFITKGSPFARRMRDPDDDMIRRVSLLIVVEYLTPY